MAKTNKEIEQFQVDLLRSVCEMKAAQRLDRGDRPDESYIVNYEDPCDIPPRNWRGVALTRHELEQILLHTTEWLTTREVERGAHGDATVTDTVVSAWVTARKVFSIEYAGQSLFPKYIFDATGQPIPAAAEVLGVFFDYPPLRLAAWFESTNSMLGGRRPREVISDDPKLVIEAARDHLIGPVHG